MVAEMSNKEQLPRRFSTNSTWILGQRPDELDKLCSREAATAEAATQKPKLFILESINMHQK
jgi:hypothetical protein